MLYTHPKTLKCARLINPMVITFSLIAIMTLDHFTYASDADVVYNALEKG